MLLEGYPFGKSWEGPFDLSDELTYIEWRRQKLENYPEEPGQLIVEVNHPARISESEQERITRLVAKTGMAIYKTMETPESVTREDIRKLGETFGLFSLDNNLFSDDDGLTALEVRNGENRGDFIPYTDRPIHWHTDGYYNSPEHEIRGLLLHCVRQAQKGGENALMDIEIAYIRLRDENPDYIKALSQSDAMTIPEHRDGEKLIRPEISVPVLYPYSDGNPGMRYTQRKRNIRWKDDPVVIEAEEYLRDILSNDPLVFRAKLDEGMGLISNNVLHDRSAFENNPERPRLLYRGRYRERVKGT